MKLGPKKDFKARKYWENMIKEWRSSGLNRREFCRLKNISLYSFDHYRYKTELDPAVNMKSHGKSKFVPVNVAASAVPASNCKAIIYLANGARVELTDFSIEWLRKLL